MRNREPCAAFSLYLHVCWERCFVESCQGAGDTTLNLLWRVQNGEGPTFSPKMAVVLIGTNDFTNPIYQLVSRPHQILLRSDSFCQTG